MKKLLSLVLALMLLCSVAYAELNDGEYTVETRGLNGPVTVVVTLKDGAITDIIVPVSSETKGIGDTAMQMLTDEILEYQNLGLGRKEC